MSKKVKVVNITKTRKVGTGVYYTVNHNEENLSELKETLTKIIEGIEKHKFDFETKSFTL